MDTPDSQTHAATSSCRPSASPSASKPGPRLALVAGTRTRTTGATEAIELGRGPSADGPARRRRRQWWAGDGAPDSAQSGSFRPLPVIVHTGRDPAGICPLALVRSSPATLADEASSPNTASLVASSR